MEDKQYLDEAGLGEVGKVINKFYVNKDDLKDLDGLKDFVSSHNEIKLHYITQEEYQKMGDEGKLPQLSDIHDPIAIAVIEPREGGAMWQDDPINILFGMGIKVDNIISQYQQNYLLFNITPNHKIIDDNISKVSLVSQLEEDSVVRLQLAFGATDQSLYWRLLNDKYEDMSWSLICDSYSKYHVDLLDKKFSTISQQIDNKVDKVQNKQLSTNDYTNEDKKKLDSINIDLINSNVNTIKVCDVEQEILSKGADAPVGFYLNSNFKNYQIQLYYVEPPRVGISNKRYTVFTISFGAWGLNRPTQTFEWENEKWNMINLPSAPPQQHSVAFRLFELERTVSQLKTALKDLSLKPQPQPPVVVQPSSYPPVE